MGRVNSSGGATDIYVKMSKYQQGLYVEYSKKIGDMYDPKEFTISFPAKKDRIYHSLEVWGHTFVKSAKNLLTGDGGVPLRFGVNVLKFAEMAD